MVSPNKRTREICHPQNCYLWQHVLYSRSSNTVRLYFVIHLANVRYITYMRTHIFEIPTHWMCGIAQRVAKKDETKIYISQLNQSKELPICDTNNICSFNSMPFFLVERFVYCVRNLLTWILNFNHVDVPLLVFFFLKCYFFYICLRRLSPLQILFHKLAFVCFGM